MRIGGATLIRKDRGNGNKPEVHVVRGIREIHVCRQTRLSGSAAKPPPSEVLEPVLWGVGALPFAFGPNAKDRYREPGQAHDGSI